MLPVRHILFPTDFSEAARAAFPQALELARHSEATLHLLHIVPLFSSDAFEAGLHIAEDARERDIYGYVGQGTKKAFEQLIGDHAPLDVPLVLAQDQGVAAAPAILAYAGASGIDLIVMGAAGKSGLRRLVVGSTTRDVVQQSAVPVLVVPALCESPVAPIRRIVAAVDFRAGSENVLVYAATLGEMLGAELHLVHVLDLATHPELYAVSLNARSRMIARLETDIKARMKAEFAAMGVDEVAARYHVCVGDAPAQIAACVSSVSADVVVLGGYIRSVLDRMMMGSVTSHLLRVGACPVLIVRTRPSQAAEAPDRIGYQARHPS